MTQPAIVRAARAADAREIADIYAHYVAHTTVTFEEAPVSEIEMAARMAAQPPHCPWLVAETDDGIQGYAYAVPWSQRSGYLPSVETTVYVAEDALRNGLGLALYSALLERLREQGLHSAIGVIALPNPASIALHEKLGFRKAGELAEAGRKLGQWVNVGYWQCLLEN